MEVIPADLVLVSIGYRSLPMPGAPFDMGRGIILNENGRVLGAEGSNSKYELGVSLMAARLPACILAVVNLPVDLVAEPRVPPFS